jgi:hypothetical protein
LERFDEEVISDPRSIGISMISGVYGHNITSFITLLFDPDEVSIMTTLSNTA